ncbi:MAG: hypothetical protein P8Z00_17200 [Anaerolineales bacterium]
MSLSLNERISNSLKALERLKPVFRLDRLPTRSGNRQHRSRKAARNELPGAINPQAPPSLEELLRQAGPFPPDTLVLGACDDGMPFTLDLNNPAPGALLYAGDQAGDNSAWLHAALASAIRLNPSRSLQLWVIAPHSEIYQDVIHHPHLRHLASPEELVTSVLIQEVLELVEQRRHDDPRGPACILAIDDLASLLHNIDAELYRPLNVVLRHGPRSRIWPIATLSASQASQVDEHLLSSFRTRLIGLTADYNLGAYLAQDDRLDASRIRDKRQFYAPLGDDWIRVWTCEPAAAWPETTRQVKEYLK